MRIQGGENMKNTAKPWNPYVSGGLSGLVSIGSVYFAGKYLGASTSFVKTTGMVEKIFSPERVAQMPYFVKEVPAIDWQWVFLVGIMIGSFIAAVTGGTFRFQGVPDMWQERFGSAFGPRALAAFSGGVIAMFGARLADG